MREASAHLCSVYIPEEYSSSRFETKQALRRTVGNMPLSSCEKNRGVVELALTADDAAVIRAKGKIAAVLDIEGSYDLDGDSGCQRTTSIVWVPDMRLSAHNWSQNYADACCSSAQWNGLSREMDDVEVAGNEFVWAWSSTFPMRLTKRSRRQSM